MVAYIIRQIRRENSLPYCISLCDFLFTSMSRNSSSRKHYIEPAIQISNTSAGLLDKQASAKWTRWNASSSSDMRYWMDGLVSVIYGNEYVPIVLSTMKR